MNRTDQELERLLDQAVAELRDEAMRAEDERAALARVWERVRSEAVRPENAGQHIRDCAGFQALLPAYVQGALNEAKTLLVADHLAECIACRKALKRARAGRPATTTAAAQDRGPGRVAAFGWYLAAAAAVFFAVVGLSLNTSAFKVRAGGVIRIESIQGELLRVSDNRSVPVAAGETVRLVASEELRTTKGSRAMLRLADASAVEMSERAGVRVQDERWFWKRQDGDAVIHLDRGSVIVEASDQGSGHLFVETRDSRVAVTGTVFAVNHGVKGTRVSVLEGRVEVAHAGTLDVLQPGDQVTTRRELARVAVADEIAWSQNLERHLALLAEMTQLGRELDAALDPARRYGTRLLDLAPPTTLVYVGLPNVSGSLDEAYAILEQKTRESEALRAWWEESVVATGADVRLREALDKVRAIGDQLGDEIVFTLQADAAGKVGAPLILAELRAPAEFRAVVERELAGTAAPDGTVADHVRIVEGDSPDLAGAAAELTVWIRGDLVVVTPDPGAISALAAELAAPAAGGTPGGVFRERLRELYAGGVEWVVGVDMERILGQATHEVDPALGGLGLLDMQHLIAEREDNAGKTENRIVLTFGQTRRGLAAWLDEPAPVGALEFVSPNATLAAAFVMRDPARVVDELFGALSGIDDDFEAQIRKFESEAGVSVRDDFAAPLGGEFAFALDGPVLPTPAWKLAVEVYDPERLQHTLDWLVAQANRLAAESGRQGFELRAEQVGERTFHALVSLDTGLSAYYTVVDGYLVAAPSRTAVQEAIATRESGITLSRAGAFTKLLPSDAEPNFSGVVYQNLGALVGPLARLGSASIPLSPEQARMVQEMAARSEPSLALAYAAADRITFVYTHEGGFLSSGLASFFSIRSLMDVPELLRQAGPDGGQDAPAPPAEAQQVS